MEGRILNIAERPAETALAMLIKLLRGRTAASVPLTGLETSDDSARVSGMFLIMPFP